MAEAATDQQPFEEWAVLELFGHLKLAGRVREVNIAGAGFIRIDVPDDSESGFSHSRFFGPSAVYGIAPTTEALARQMARGLAVAPISRYELPQLPKDCRPKPAVIFEGDEPEDDDDDE